jgi:hypothetical protein
LAGLYGSPSKRKGLRPTILGGPKASSDECRNA